MILSPQISTRRERRRRTNRRRRSRSLILSTLVVSGATVLGMAGAGGTYAFLSAQQATEQVVVTAGDLSLQINGAVSADLGSWQITPATPAARAFAVSSVSEGRLTSRLVAVVTPTSGSAIIANTQLRITPVPNEAACTVGLAGPLADITGYRVTDPALLNAGETRYYCVEARLKAGTPASQSGQSVPFTVNLTTTQVNS